MFIIWGLLTYLTICLISGLLQVRALKAEHPALYSADIARRIMLNPPDGKGLVQELVAKAEGELNIMPSKWYALKSRSTFNGWALIFVGMAMFFGSGMIDSAMGKAQTGGEFYAGMLTDIFQAIGLFFLIIFKCVILGFAYLMMVSQPNTQALRIERDHWRDR